MKYIFPSFICCLTCRNLSNAGFVVRAILKNLKFYQIVYIDYFQTETILLWKDNANFIWIYFQFRFDMPNDSNLKFDICNDFNLKFNICNKFNLKIYICNELNLIASSARFTFRTKPE